MTVTDEPARADLIWLDDQLYEFNAARTGFADGRWLAIFERDDSGAIIAGLYGWTWGEACEVRTLWVQEAHRGRGLGTELLQAAEHEARARGAKQMVLDTHSFQAPDFYRRFGYERVGVLDDYPRGHQKIFLRKRLE